MDNFEERILRAYRSMSGKEKKVFIILFLLKFYKGSVSVSGGTTTDWDGKEKMIYTIVADIDFVE